MKHAWLIACCGCQQLFGLDSPSLDRDAHVDGDAVVVDADAAVGDATPDTLAACLRDDFDDNSIGAMWTRVSALHQVAETSGELQVMLGSTVGYDGLFVSNIDGTDAQVDVEVLDTVSGPSGSTFLNVSLSVESYASMYVVSGNLTFLTADATSTTMITDSIAYDASTHRYWRIAFVPSKVQFWTSFDGVTWVMRRERDIGFALNPLSVGIGAGKPTSQPAGGTSRHDNFIVRTPGCAP